MENELLKEFATAENTGTVFRQGILEKYNISPYQASVLLRLDRNTLATILNGKQRISTLLCVKLSIVFNEKAKDWAELQLEFDLRKARDKVNKLNLKPYGP